MLRESTIMMNKRHLRPFMVPYYEGYLEKRSFKDKKSRKLWTCLCGNTLYFFNDKRDTDYIEKLDISGPISITDDNTVDFNLEAAKLNLQTKDNDLKISAPNAEARELWKGLIQSVAELAVPLTLNLLPGQKLMLEEVVKKEKERLQSVQQSSPSADVEPTKEMPDCFHPVSRSEAELFLEHQASRGNLLLRPSSDGTGFAISTREEMNGAIFKHYRVSCKQDEGFVIDVDSPVPCASLHDIVKYFLEATQGALIPLVREETYEQNISYIALDNENGEKSVRGASMHTAPPFLQSKPALPRVLSEDGEENVYVNDNNKDCTVERLPEPESKTPGKSMKTPTPAPRRFAPSPSPPTATRSKHGREQRLRNHTNLHGQTISELKLRFEKRARCVD